MERATEEERGLTRAPWRATGRREAANCILEYWRVKWAEDVASGGLRGKRAGRTRRVSPRVKREVAEGARFHGALTVRAGRIW